MKLLLTSGGVTNDSIRAALVALLGRPIEDCDALVVPTAAYGHPALGPDMVHRFVSGSLPNGLAGLGWKSVGALDLTALPTVPRERWESWVRQTDVLLVEGGSADYLAYWMRESGLADVVRTADHLVWVGLSAGSMVLTPRIGADFVEWAVPGDDRGLGLVDFSIFPHLGMEPENLTLDAERWAADLAAEAYALDDESAIVVDGNRVDVVSEGTWRHFPGG